MKTLIQSAVVLLLLNSPRAVAQSAVERKINQLEKEINKAFCKSDVDILSKMEAENIVNTGPDGIAHSKTDDLSDAKTGKFKCDDIEIRDIKVTGLGNTALATGLIGVKNGKYGDKDISGDYRFTDVWVKSGGQWQLLATQATAVHK